MNSDFILRYYALNRRVGHTHAMLKGAENTDCIVLTANQRHAEQLKKQSPHINFASIGQYDKLLGTKKPLLLDHFTIENIILEQNARIRELDVALALSRLELARVLDGIKFRESADKIHWRCYLFGHSGENFESGYHVCERCGLHSYHCDKAYQKSAVLFTPFHAMKRFYQNTCYKIRNKVAYWKKHDDDLPF
jgi:ribosomal protein L37E